MSELNYEKTMEQLLTRDPRYHREAYQFLREALDYSQKAVASTRKEPVRHITGQELLSGIRDYGLSQFGPMTKDVFEEWGVKRCEDWGEMVFNMVECELLSKTDKDSREDFKEGYDFETAFRQPFIPKSKNGSSIN